MGDKNDTLREIDALCEALANAPTTSDEPPLLLWLAKIRAHAVSDELERKRLQATVLLSTSPGGFAPCSEAVASRMLDLSPNWRVAPQEARRAAHLMPPARICAERFAGDDGVICHRKPKHSGEHCPVEVEDGACGVDHG